MRRLLKVPMSEVKEQQKLYEDERIPQNETLRTPKPKKRRTSLAALTKKTDAVAGSVRQQKK